MGKDIMKELDKEYDSDEVLEKEINQLEKVRPVTKSLSDMANFYKKIMNKLIEMETNYLRKEMQTSCLQCGEIYYGETSVSSYKVDKNYLSQCLF